MKKANRKSDDIRPEYTRADFKNAVRGKYYERVKASSNIVVIDPEMTRLFPNSEAVNKALHSLVKTPRRKAKR